MTTRTSRDAWARSTRDALRAGGHRTGGAREAVVELLAEQDCCLSAHEIHDRLRAREQTVGIASVYRALDVLAGMGLVHRLEMGDGTARFEPVVPEGHHHHVVCERCGRVDAFEDPALEEAIDRVASHLAYAVSAHDVVLRGLCPTCRAAA